jgi:hypothetical protein
LVDLVDVDEGAGADAVLVVDELVDWGAVFCLALFVGAWLVFI